jgi:tRNA dimethylallyltransferase
VALVGPTASGKTRLALELAERLELEVVSADSRAVYRWMDIGTAKPTLAERRQVPHHLIDVVDPDEPYTLAHYQDQALAAISRIAARGKLPLLVGGAGLYVSAVCDGLALPNVEPDAEFRAQMELLDWQTLRAKLRAVDPASAERIDPKNVRRVIRALEVSHVTGRPFSEWQKPVPSSVNATLVGLRLERAELYARIDQRIDAWIASGFVEEVRGLVERGYAPTLPSMSGIGYREIARMLNGETDLADAVAQIKQATHQYAKRQMTWFGRDARIHWLDAARATATDVLERYYDISSR